MTNSEKLTELRCRFIETRDKFADYCQKKAAQQEAINDAFSYLPLKELLQTEKDYGDFIDLISKQHLKMTGEFTGC